MTVQVTINTCKDCRHLDHSGAFTPGGALPVCGHNDACYGSHAVVKPGASVHSVLTENGMDAESAEKFETDLRKNDPEAIGRILLKDHKPGDCYIWIHRVPFKNWDKPSIPDWCPLKNKGAY